MTCLFDIVTELLSSSDFSFIYAIFICTLFYFFLNFLFKFFMSYVEVDPNDHSNLQNDESPKNDFDYFFDFSRYGDKND